MIKLRIILIVLILTIYYVESCNIPRIRNGQIINSKNGEILRVGSDYDDYDAVSVKCDSGYSILTIRPGDNNVLCLPEDLNDNTKWNQEFKECKSVYWVHLI